VKELNQKSNVSTRGAMKRDVSKNRIVFDLFHDTTASHPSILFGIRGESEPYLPGCFDPFLEVTVAKDNSLKFSLYTKGWTVSLSVEQWEAIARHARKYHKNILAGGTGY
jgi:hypothetical protein